MDIKKLEKALKTRVRGRLKASSGYYGALKLVADSKALKVPQGTRLAPEVR